MLGHAHVQDSASASLWAAPSALADLYGLERTVKELERYSLPVPEILKSAVKGEIPRPLFNLPNLAAGRYLGG